MEQTLLAAAKMRRGTKFKGSSIDTDKQPEEELSDGETGAVIQRYEKKTNSDVIQVREIYLALIFIILGQFVEPTGSISAPLNTKLDNIMQPERSISDVSGRAEGPEEELPRVGNFSDEPVKMIDWPGAERLVKEEIESKQDDPAQSAGGNGRGKQHLMKLLSRPRQILSAFVPQTLSKQLVIGSPDNLMASNLKRIHKKLYSSTSQRQQEIQSAAINQLPPANSFTSYAQLLPVTLIQSRPQPTQVDVMGALSRPSQITAIRPIVPIKAANLLSALPSPRQIVVVNKLTAPQSRFMLESHHTHHHLRPQAPVVSGLHQIQQVTPLIRLHEPQPLKQVPTLAVEPGLEADQEVETEREMEHIDHMIRSEYDNHVSMNEHGSTPQQQELLVSYVRNGSSFPNHQHQKYPEEETGVFMWDQAPESEGTSDAEQHDAGNRWRPAEFPQVVHGSGELSTGNGHLMIGRQQDETEGQFKPLKLHYKPLVVESIGKLSTSGAHQQPFVPTALETIARLNTSSTSTGSNSATTISNHNNGALSLTSADRSTLPFSGDTAGNKMLTGATQGINDTKSLGADNDELSADTQGIAVGHHKLPVVGQQEEATSSDGGNGQQQETVDSIEQLMTALSSSDYLDGKNAAQRLSGLSTSGRHLQMQPLRAQQPPQQVPYQQEPAALNETLRRLRETKARIRQLQAELNATDPHLWRLKFNQTRTGGNLGRAGGSHAVKHQAELLTSSTPDVLSGNLAEWLKRWPSLSVSSKQQLADKNWHNSTTSGRLSALNLPMGFYHNGPLTAPARIMAAALGQATRSRDKFEAGGDSVVVLGSDLSVASGRETAAAGAVNAEPQIEQQTNRSQLSKLATTSQVTPVNGSIQIDLSARSPANLAASQESSPPSVEVSSTAASTGDTISISPPQRVAELDELHRTRQLQQQQHQQQIAVPENSHSPPVMQAREDRVMHTPVWSSGAGIVARPQPSVQQSGPQAGVEATTIITSGRLLATTNRRLEYLPSAHTNGNGSHDVQYGADNSIARHLVKSRPGEEHGSAQFQPRLLALNPRPGHANLMQQQQPPLHPKMHHHQEPKMTTERLLHSLIGLSCSLAVGSLLIIVALVRCHQMRQRRRRHPRSPLLKTIDASSSCLANASLKSSSGAGGGERGGGGGPLAALCNQLDWRRFQSVSEANERQRHDKLILDGTMRNVSLLARYHSDERPSLEERLDKQAALASSTSLKVPLPTLNRSCCHCVTCSASWLFRDSGTDQSAASLQVPAQSQPTGAGCISGHPGSGAGTEAIGSESGQHQQASSGQTSNKQNDRLLCSSGFYHPAPRGKLPFGAASSVNKFLAADHDGTASASACPSSSIRCQRGGSRQRHVARGGTQLPSTTSVIPITSDTNNNSHPSKSSQHQLTGNELVVIKQQEGGPQRLRLISAIEECLRNMRDSQRGQRANLLVAIGKLANDEGEGEDKQVLARVDRGDCTCGQCGAKSPDSSNPDDCTCQCQCQCQSGSPVESSEGLGGANIEEEDGKVTEETTSAKQAIENCDTAGQHSKEEVLKEAEGNTGAVKRLHQPSESEAQAKSPHQLRSSHRRVTGRNRVAEQQELGSSCSAI